MKKGWLKDSFEEITIWATNICKLKDVYLALLIVSGVAHCIGIHLLSKANDKADKAVKNIKIVKDSCKAKIDSCKIVIINQKYGN